MSNAFNHPRQCLIVKVFNFLNFALDNNNIGWQESSQLCVFIKLIR